MGFIVACEDEATFGLIPTISRGWARKGSQPIALRNNQHEATNVFGARTIKTFVFAFYKRKTQRCFVDFLQKLLRKFRRICLFIDNAPGHHGKLVVKFIEMHKKTFHIEYFPKYSPELNPVEPCWKPARKEVGNRLIRSLSSLKYRVSTIFKRPFLMPKMFKYLSD